MVIETRFDSISEIAALQRLASKADEQVLISAMDDSIKVDARSFLGLFTLDFAQPVKVITDSMYVLRRLEMASRAKTSAQVG